MDSTMLYVVLIVLVSTGGWLINNWIRARHGYPIENEWSGTTTREDPEAGRKLDFLAADNARLLAKVSRLEERIAVLERIVTDPANRTAQEIDALR
ncbi:hypothetical protein [Sphingomonas sanxanigenens]|uniref:Uncharacterized protein n=1 Tax=Sphingomonas sanxanigenens DSM 19645 = NX02 TaxID=1123269 RepID=W0A8T8_9SPHN|nr:hypothetical protein [Sphingomonas sanxanigenens]AHE54339.1 hypothetical protein NX02_13205 [Sphingomonas sanxanigenens DSM 19645 = NX02]